MKLFLTKTPLRLCRLQTYEHAWSSKKYACTFHELFCKMTLLLFEEFSTNANETACKSCLFFCRNRSNRPLCSSARLSLVLVQPCSGSASLSFSCLVPLRRGVYSMLAYCQSAYIVFRQYSAVSDTAIGIDAFSVGQFHIIHS